MDFHELMNFAASKHENLKKSKINRYSLDLPAPKKEDKSKPRSEAVQKLIREKEREKQEKEEAERTERERIEKEERKKKIFRIPKKKADETPSIDKESLINSLFDDSGILSDNESPHASENKYSKEQGKKDRSDMSKSHSSREKSSSSPKPKSDHHSSQGKSSSPKPKSDHHSSVSNGHSERHKDSHDSKSDKKVSSHSSSSHKSSSHKHFSSSSTSKTSDLKSSSSSQSSKDNDKKSSSHRDSSSSHHRSSSKDKSKSSSSSHHRSKHSGTSSGLEKSQKSSSSQSKTSQSKSSSSSSTTGQDSTKSAISLPLRRPSDEQPVTLAKDHLNPLVERHAAPAAMSEKEKILARLKAIKERTLAAIHKENTGKGKRMKGEKSSHRKSGKEERHEEKLKSVEIVRDDGWSDDDDKVDNSVPSALDIMLSENNAKLEKEKIARMAKQAWARATKKDTGEDSDQNLKVKKKRQSSLKDKNGYIRDKKHTKSRHKDNHSRSDDSLSPDPRHRKSSPKPKKPVIVRHAGQAAPPPMDFQSILAMAEKKQKDPPKPMAAIPKKKKKDKEERPLTQEEKDRRERIKSKEYQEWLKHGGKPPGHQSDEEASPPRTSSHSDNSVRKPSSQPPGKIKPPIGSNSVTSSGKNSFGRDPIKQQHQRHPPGSNHRNITVNENVLVCGPADESEDESSKVSQNPFDRIMKTVHKKRPAPGHSSAFNAKKRRMEEIDNYDDEDEDSDLDGFIDDGDDGEPSYSKEIQKLFGYNRHKYVDEDDDDLSNMEADYSTVMREEKRSAKLGLQEDLEDMRREEEELKQKAMLKKQMRKGKF